MDYEQNPDLLSVLPLSIIHDILARVPIREAVRTSILSTQWRYTWISLHRLVFEDSWLSPNPEDRITTSKMENTITRVLSRHHGPIHKFEMSVFLDTMVYPEEWVFFLSRNGIRELILLNFSSYNRWSLHSSIYFCKKLTVLNLWNCQLDSPPSTFKGFLFLRCLSLSYIDLSIHEIESLVNSCPLLERFELDINGAAELRIRAPNLKYFCLRGGFEELCLDAPLIDEIDLAWLNKDGSDACNYTKFFVGITNLKRLTRCYRFTKYLSMGIESCGHSLSFHRLEVINLAGVHFNDTKEKMVVARLIIGAPNLQKLKIGLTGDHDASESDDASFRDLGFALNFKLHKLRIVKINWVRAFPLVDDFIKFLLDSSPALETMSLRLLEKDDTDVVKDLRDGVMGYSRASPSAKISVLTLLSK